MEDVKIKTRTGALLTMVSAAIILAFTTLEFFDYRRVGLDTSVIVDRSRGEKLLISMNVTFPNVPCYLLGVDVMDISGERQNDISHTMIKLRQDENGQIIHEGHSIDLKSKLDKVADARGPDYCGSCYGGVPPEDKGGCCNTCEDVRESYIQRGWSFADPAAIDQCVAEHWTDTIQSQSKEGCNLSGKIRVNKVVGSVHISAGRSFQSNSMNHYDLVPYLRDGNIHSFGHRIHHLQFQSESEEYKWELSESMKRKLGIVVSPLDGHWAYTQSSQYMFQYFLKVVATRYHFLNEHYVDGHQFSVTTYERDLGHGGGERNTQGFMTAHNAMGMPGAIFNFDISPMLVVHRETRQSFAHFITSTCAIVGGVLTIASILDAALFSAGRALKNSGSGSNGYSGKMM